MKKSKEAGDSSETLSTPSGNHHPPAPAPDTVPRFVPAPQIPASGSRRESSVLPTGDSRPQGDGSVRGFSPVARGRPAPPPSRHFQYSRHPARCQRAAVRGFTTTRTSVQRGQNLRIRAQNNRSTRFERGRERLSFRTPNCCRSARISSALSLRLRKSAPAVRSNTTRNPATAALSHSGSLGSSGAPRFIL